MTFFLKWIAPLIAILVVVGLIYGKGSLDSKHAAELQTVKDQLAVAQDTIELEKAVRAKDTVIAQHDAVFLTDLNTNIDGLNSYAKALPDADRECLSGADTDKLRALWR
jgi:hypothetical protein